MTLHEFQVIGRLSPTTKNPNPKLYRMRIFAPNAVVARSRYWYFISRLVKAKKGTGEILTVNRIYDTTPHKVKNFGVLLRYNSRSGTHNLYKEFRDVTREGAVNQLYADMAARHRARFPSIHVIDVKEVAAAQCRRAATKQFHNSTIKFPLPHRVVRPSSKKFTKTFAPSRPHTFF